MSQVEVELRNSPNLYTYSDTILNCAYRQANSAVTFIRIPSGMIKVRDDGTFGYIPEKLVGIDRTLYQVEAKFTITLQR